MSSSIFCRNFKFIRPEIFVKQIFLKPKFLNKNITFCFNNTHKSLDINLKK